MEYACTCGHVTVYKYSDKKAIYSYLPTDKGKIIDSKMVLTPKLAIQYILKSRDNSDIKFAIINCVRSLKLVEDTIEFKKAVYYIICGLKKWNDIRKEEVLGVLKRVT
jgi:hypothetical protein